MYEEILIKKNILNQRKPYEADAARQLKRMELWDLIYTSLHLDGSEITKEQVIKILEGEYVVEATINDHLAIEIYVDVMSLIDNLMAIQSDIDIKVIEDINEAVCDGEGQLWRRRNPVLYTFDYNPPPWDEIDGKMEGLMRWLYCADEELNGNTLLKAAYFHCKLIEIYPFEFYNEVTARIAMYYLLLREGYPIFELRTSESEYNRAVLEYLRFKRIEPFYKLLERNLFNKLDVILQVTATEEE